MLCCRPAHHREQVKKHRLILMHHIYNNQSGSDGSRINQTDYLDDSSVGFLEFWLKRSWLLWVLAAVIFAFDQVTKQMIEGWLAYGESWPADGFLRFTHIGNTGTAFSLFQGNSNILSIVALIAIGLLLWVYRTTGGQSLIIRFALGLQLGGAIGNLTDRLVQGYVTDFFDVGPWPIFNIADSAISVGMVLMLSYFFFFSKRDAVTAPADYMMPSEDAAYLTANDYDSNRYSQCSRCADSIRYGTLNRDADDASTLDNHPL